MTTRLDEQLKGLLDKADLRGLFRQMGWDNPPSFYRSQSVEVPKTSLQARAVADKRGVTVWEVKCPEGLPGRIDQHRVVRDLRRRCRDQLTIFVEPGGGVSDGFGRSRDRTASGTGWWTTSTGGVGRVRRFCNASGRPRSRSTRRMT